MTCQVIQLVNHFAKEITSEQVYQVICIVTLVANHPFCWFQLKQELEEYTELALHEASVD